MSINPITGLPEFGFFKKAFKSIKKVARKAAPVLQFVPGPIGALSGTINKVMTVADVARGKASPLNLLTLGKGTGGLESLTGGKVGDFLGNVFGRTPGINPTAERGILGGTLGPRLRRGASDFLSGLFGGGAGTKSVEVAAGDTLSQIAAANNTTVEALLDANPEIKDRDIIEIGQKIKIPTTASGLASLPQAAGNFLSGLVSGGGADNKGNFGAIGDFLGGGFGGGLASAGLGGFLGKLAYDAARDRAGGLAVTPQVSMDALGRYQLASDLGTGGTRGQFGLAPKPAVLDIANMGQRQAFSTGDEARNLGLDFGKPGLGLAQPISPTLPNPNRLQELIDGWAQVTVEGGQVSRDLSPEYIDEILKESGRDENDPALNQMLQEALQKEFKRKRFAVGGVAELDLREGGESIGPGTGTSDDIPAMLSDGEFVMTAKATRGAGAFNMKKNKSGIELVKGGKPSREEGVKNMRELMNIFESI
jgi:LysM repeat protein/polyhydroxyalkanoate synthesis regulator phasin